MTGYHRLLYLMLLLFIIISVVMIDETNARFRRTHTRVRSSQSMRRRVTPSQKRKRVGNPKTIRRKWKTTHRRSQPNDENAFDKFNRFEQFRFAALQKQPFTNSMGRAPASQSIISLPTLINDHNPIQIVDKTNAPASTPFKKEIAESLSSWIEDLPKDTREFVFFKLPANFETQIHNKKLLLFK